MIGESFNHSPDLGWLLLAAVGGGALIGAGVVLLSGYAIGRALRFIDKQLQKGEGRNG